MSYDATFAGSAPSADLASQNPTLDQFQICQESDTKAFKMGPGAWNSLGYSGGTGVFADTSTALTLSAKHNGAWITCSNASAITITVPSGLGKGFSCVINQIGAGRVTISGSGTTINNVSSQSKTSGQHAVVSLFAYAADVFNLSGSTGT